MFKAMNQDRQGNKVNFLLTSALDDGIMFSVTLHPLGSKLCNGIYNKFSIFCKLLHNDSDTMQFHLAHRSLEGRPRKQLSCQMWGACAVKWQYCGV